MTQKEILDAYNRQKSIRATARDLGISEAAVRKVLVTYRVIDTPLVRRIAELRAAGMPNKDIAALLDISTNCVDVNSPYARGTYLKPSKTLNAERIRECRARKAARAAEEHDEEDQP